jgi:hypothetical protein
MSNATVIELPFGRESFGGDSDAINRHSIRHYVSSSGSEYTLDRTLDGCPPFFTLWAHTTSRHAFIPSFGRAVPVDGAEQWGDGWSWSRAEAAALAAINALEAVAA